MLQKLSDRIKNCLDRAADAKRRADETADPSLKAEHLRLGRSWVRLARSYEFAESLERFLLKAGSTTSAIWQSRILEAYNSLKDAHEELGGQLTASLARHGQYEVRLFELSRKSQSGAANLWLELFDHHHKLTIDSYNAHNLEDTAARAESLCSKAKRLNESSD
jgi:hypothetical protein